MSEEKAKIQLDEAKIIEEYRSGANVTEIAEKYGTYGNKIHRILKKAGEPKRSVSEIQSDSIKRGRKVHPTKNKKMSTETKKKISKAIANHWENLTPDELYKRSETAKELWAAKSDSSKEQMKKEAFKKLRLAGIEGSKAEKFVVEGLRKANYSVQHHRENVLKREKMELDIFIPELQLAIEIDGKMHTEALFGEQVLKTRQHADFIKNSLIVAKGFSIIRVIMKSSKSSKYYLQKVLDALLQKIEELAKIRNCDRIPQVWKIEVE